ncbi:MAG: hypothetical protein AAGA54_16985, partial [Myxococcota bacterium]
MSVSLAPLALALALAPAASDPAPASPAAPAPAYEGDVEADIDVILTDSSKAYLQARARLEAHPAAAAPALLARLQAVPAPGPSERRRLMGVLAQMRRPEDLELFAAELRRTVVNADRGTNVLEVADPWRNLLLEQGPAAAPAVQTLVGDTALPVEVRAQLLRDLVRLKPAAQTGQLVVLVGRGQDELERGLRRALVDRARKEASVRTAVVAATDAALDAALASPPDETEAARLPALLRFRARVAQGDEASVAQRLELAANDADARFGVRVAALRGLGLLDAPAAVAALQAIATAQLDPSRRDTQRGELLGWLAIDNLPEAEATRLSSELRLIESDAPRLAVLGYTYAPRDGAQTWLSAAMDNPWPQVRQAAFERVQAPCTADEVDVLATRGSATGEGGDTDRAAARASVAALGRCGGPVAMRRLKAILTDANGDMELRAEAARRLAKHGGPDGAKAVIS